MDDRKLMQVRLPDELKAWVKEQSELNGASQNSEVIRAIRCAKERAEHTYAADEVAHK